MRIAAIDQGTTSTRILVFDTDGSFRLIGSRNHNTTYPKPGWVEQDGNELLTNIGALLVDAGPVEAIGLANQGESCLAWDAITCEPLSPVIVWQDCRTLVLLETLSRAGAADIVAARAALPLDPYFSAAKLGWILRELPRAAEAFAAGRLRLGTTDAFFLQRMTGHFATDRATASRTSLMNIETGEWDPELCRLFGVPIECLPEIRANTAGFGHMSQVPVAASIVDQQASLFGHGCRAPGDAKITFGTGAFALAITGSTVPRKALFSGLVPTVAWDLGKGITYAIDGGIQDAGSAIEWALRAGIASSLEDFTFFPDQTAVERGLVFVPAFSGLGCPIWDRTASPLIIGLRPDMQRSDICQALLEGVAFLTSSALEAMGQHVELGKALSIDGGMAKNEYFRWFLADCSGYQVVTTDILERTAYGVAALAAQALGERLELPPSARNRHTTDGGGKQWMSRFMTAVGRSRNWNSDGSS